MSNLPFLNKKKQVSGSGIVTEYRGPDEAEEAPEPYNESDLKDCAAALMHYIQANDAEGVARALKEAFELCDSAPHEEGPHTNEGEEY